jgi:hypothetical protein
MANRFWVGGAGTWDGSSTANWSTTSGGGAGASAPTTADVAIFDSGSGSGVVSLDATATANNVTINQATITLQLAANVAFTALGVVTLTTGVLDLNGFDLSAGYLATDNNNARSILSGGGQFNLSGNNSFVVLAQNLTNITVDVNPVFNFTYAGATGTRTYRWGNSTGGTEAKAANVNVTAGTDTFIVTGGSVIGNLDFTGFAGSWTNSAFFALGGLTVSTGMTVSAGAGVVSFAATTGTRTITTNGKTLDFPLTFGPTTFGTPTATWIFADALTQGSTRAFTFTNGTIQLKNGVASTVGAFATSGANLKFLQSTSAGSQANIRQATGTVTVTNLSIRDSLASGGATFTALIGSGNINAGGNLGWNFGTPGKGAGRGIAMTLGLSI